MQLMQHMIAEKFKILPKVLSLKKKACIDIPDPTRVIKVD